MNNKYLMSLQLRLSGSSITPVQQRSYIRSIIKRWEVKELQSVRYLIGLLTEFLKEQQIKVGKECRQVEKKEGD